jgi:VanZ family protein
MSSARPDEAQDRRVGPSNLARWAPVLVWMAVVFYFSSLSQLGVLRRVPDWISHPLEYGLGAVLVCRALAGDLRRPVALGVAIAAVFLVTAYGVTDEYHQSFVPGRDADPLDVVKDFAGATLATAALRRWGPGLFAASRADRTAA